MSPENRASALFLKISRVGNIKVVGMPAEDEVRSLLSQAIREAQASARNEALEEAAAIAQAEADFAARHQRPGGGLSEGQIAATAIELEIEKKMSRPRNLKTKA